MSRRHTDKGRISEPFVPLLKPTLASPAWRAMSHGARSLYVALKARYSSNFRNNGKIYLSHRDAIKELGSGFEEISNWFYELEFYGFITMTQGGSLGVDGKGKAPHWQLTELGYMLNPVPTKDFMKWDGTKYKRRRPRRKQNPATGSRSSLLRKAVAPPLRKAEAINGTTATESRSIQQVPAATESRSITSIPSTGAAGAPLPASEACHALGGGPVHNVGLVDFARATLAKLPWPTTLPTVIEVADPDQAAAIRAACERVHQ